MRNPTRLTSLAVAVVLTATLAACGSQPMSQSNPSAYPTTTYPSSSYPSSQYPQSTGQYVEYGRVTSVQVIAGQDAGRTSGAGAVIGGIAGGVVGNQIGGGSGRDIARIAGVVGGAIAGNAIERNNNQNVQTASTYRVSVQTDNGAMRAYDLSGSTDLRAGDRVRIDNGQLFRY